MKQTEFSEKSGSTAHLPLARQLTRALQSEAGAAGLWLLRVDELPLPLALAADLALVQGVPFLVSCRSVRKTGVAQS